MNENVYILHIETSTTLCSVALSCNNKLITCIEENNGYAHAEKLHVFIDKIIKESGLLPSQLSAISVGLGPGSYTGLRIGLSAAKGLAYSLNIPLIGHNSLHTMAKGALIVLPEFKDLFCPMLDARRMEVYVTLLQNNLTETLPTQAKVIDIESIKVFEKEVSVLFFGDGMPKCKELLSANKKALFLENVFPSAQYMLESSFTKFQKQAFINVAYCEPIYLKEFGVM